MWFLPVLLRNLLSGPATEPFPFGAAFAPKTLRGRVQFDASACTGCRVCAYVCPAGAIAFAETPDGLEFTLWHDSCVFCGLCVHYCLSKALRQTDDWHLSHLQADKFSMVERDMIPIAHCADCGKAMQRASPQLMAHVYRATSAEIEKLRRLCPDCRPKATLMRPPRRSAAPNDGSTKNAG
jgi:formate hydrogenlyase subunit 6/NADH:ubiquinone oxidoreductase subunit I